MNGTPPRIECDLNDPERKRILFVDDEPRVLDGLRRMLHTMRAEWDMVFAPGAGEALAALAEQPFDVIVTDMRMPGMDGADLLNQVVALHPQTIRLVLSGQWDQEMVIRAACTAHRYLAKPCSADHLKAALRRIFTLRSALAGKTLKRVIAGLISLPSLPANHRRLMETLDDPQCSASALRGAIAQDAASAAKILQLANSSFFGASQRVNSIDEAVVHLGVDTIQALAASPGVFAPFAGDPSEAAALEQIARHSVASARIAQGIGVLEGVSQSILDDAFLAALLHDIGSLVLMTMDPEMYRLIASLSASGGSDAASVERELFGATHAQAGAYLLSLWGLPPQIAEAAMYHHSPRSSPSTGLSAVALVYAADALASELELNVPQQSLDRDYFAEMGLAARLPAWRALAHGAAMYSGGMK